MVSDINRGTCPCKDIVCLVIDEAHRATGQFSPQCRRCHLMFALGGVLVCEGNYAFVTVVKELSAVTQNFRVLALSGLMLLRVLLFLFLAPTLHVHVQPRLAVK
jgi:hypothetical protein